MLRPRAADFHSLHISTRGSANACLVVEGISRSLRVSAKAWAAPPSVGIVDEHVMILRRTSACYIASAGFEV